VVAQLSSLAEKTLVGYNDLPHFVQLKLHSMFSSKVETMNSARILNEGFPLILKPIVDIEHSGTGLNVDILATIPNLDTTADVCSVENLMPVKYNISGKCYAGPVVNDELALITCGDIKSVARVQSIDKCFKNEKAILCHADSIKPVEDLEWLGLPYTQRTRLSFNRNHREEDDCSGLIPLIHIGGRTFLSTTEGIITLQTGKEIQTSPLAVYTFPCNVSFSGMKTGLAECSPRLNFNMPLFLPEKLTYVNWDPKDHQQFKLHYDRMDIPKPLQFNRSILKQASKSCTLR